MSAITVKVWDSAGGERSLNQLLSFRYSFSQQSPCGFWECEVGDAGLSSWIHRIQVSLEGRVLFSGKMDRQVWEQKSTGSLCRITARSDTAALLDNQAPPVTYQNYSLNQLLYDHGYPYGLTGSSLPGGTLEQIICPQGMSHWEFLQFYCRLLLGYQPWVDEEGRLVHEKSGGVQSFALGEYESFTLTVDRTQMISRLFVLDDTGQYRPIANRFAQALLAQRTQYYAPPGRWRENLTQAAGNRFCQAQMDYLTGELTLSGLRRFSLGQRVNVEGRGISASGLELIGIVLEGDGGGVHTRLTLWDPAAKLI